MVRFIHTADLQIGMPFHRVPGDKGARLRAVRLEALREISRVAAEHEVDFVVVAGDFFDANTVADEVVVQACERLSRIPVPVYILPGNHDFCGGPGSVYHRASFLKNRPGHVTVLEKPEPVVAAGGAAVILPAPLHHRRIVGESTAHLTADFGREAAPGAVRIGLAHGGVVAFELDWEEKPTNFVDPDRVESAELDYLALGDWHGLLEVRPRTWYSGTPEPTSFKSRNPGYLLVVEVAARGAEPRVVPVQVARTRWLSHEVELNTDPDLDALASWFASLDRPEDTVVRLNLRGTLTLAGVARLDELLTTRRHLLLDLRVDDSVVPMASDEELLEIATDGYLRSTVDELRGLVAQGGEQGAIAARALQVLYQLHREIQDAAH